MNLKVIGISRKTIAGVIKDLQLKLLTLLIRDQIVFVWLFDSMVLGMLCLPMKQ